MIDFVLIKIKSEFDRGHRDTKHTDCYLDVTENITNTTNCTQLIVHSALWIYDS